MERVAPLELHAPFIKDYTFAKRYSEHEPHDWTNSYSNFKIRDIRLVRVLFYLFFGYPF